MRKANLRETNDLVLKRLAETQMNPYDRERALHVLDAAQEIADAILWVKARLESFGASFLKPGLKH